MTTTTDLTTPETLSEDLIEVYRERGFVHVPSVISKEEAAEFREAALAINADVKSRSEHAVFQQFVNVWVYDDAMKRLTMHPNVAGVARKLAGTPLRLWHDHILIKEPHNEVATEFHQDQPYWPHRDSPCTLSAWIALCDVPVERGCMTFIEGSHRYTDVPEQSLLDPRDFLTKCPELEWAPRVTLPLKAGDCTFHHARSAHMATPNNTDEHRVAHVVIYMDARTTWTAARPHCVTDPLELEDGQPLTGEMFPDLAP
jgi:ectoine hydroxylase-related dioxygenase (phytanoyl-CoA dioxygenase family)